MHWIDAKELEAWANRHEAQSELPALIRRLVVNTVARPQGVDIPSGSSVTIGGWDGTFDSDGGSVIPAGKVACEFSTGSDAATKANQNYQKRTKDSLGATPSETAFIFVTPRVWTKKGDWERDRRSEGKWKDVRVIDATILAQWIDASPVVGSYFARQIGKTPPAGLIALTDFWEEWSKATKPASVPSLLLGGRDKQAKELTEWARGPASSFFVQGEKVDDAIALLAAWATIDDEVGPSILARALVVTTHDAWLDLSRRKNALVLIPTFAQEFSASVATANGHHLLLPLARDARLVGSGCVIPRQDRDAFIAALKEMGLEDHEAKALSGSTGRHLPTLRRRLIDHAGGSKPVWAKGSTAKALVPALLLGQWKEVEGDLSALRALSNKPAQETLADYQTLLNQPDAPIRKIGDHWHLISHEEAWELLSAVISASDADKFRSLATDVLSEISPALALDPSERHLAGIRGATMARSGTLREGVAATLALMATRRPESSPDLSTIPTRVLRDVFEANIGDWRFWATVGGELSPLAEAHPDSFLSAVEEGLALSPSPFLELFNQESSGVFGACYHSGLLWGLERAAMSADHFSRAVLALARLAAIDPGGKYTNRPLESLRSLFLGWIHFTDAADAERLKVLDLICERVPEVGWKLLIAISPGGHEHVTHREPAAFRSWGQEMVHGPTNQDYASFALETLEKLKKYVGANPERWKALIGELTPLQDEDKGPFIDLLDTVTKEIFDPAQWEAVRKTLRELLHRHRAYPDVDWAMAPELSARVEAIYERLKPGDPVLANGWLFDYWPNLPEGGRRSDEETAKRIQTLQREAFRAVYEDQKAAGIERLIAKSANSAKTGEIAGKYFADNADVRRLIIANLADEEMTGRAFAGAAAAAIYYDGGGWVELERLLDEARKGSATDDGIALIHLGAKADEGTWKHLERENGDVQKSYWSRLNTWVISQLSDDEYVYAINILLEYGRAADVVDEMAYGRDTAPTELMVRALELTPAAIAAEAAAGRPLAVSSHDIARVFERLDEAGVDNTVIARLELPFVSLLHHDRGKLALHREVTKDSVTFADLVTWAFKRRDGRTDDETMPDDEREFRATTAWSILYHILVLPGELEDGSIDSDQQLKWVQEAKRICSERGRDVVGRQTIGQVLGCSPAGADGIWPHESVRRTLEMLSDREIGKGFTIRKRNLRGVTSRSMTTGGQPERQLAAKYREDAQKLRAEFPFTASLLQAMAASYEHEAVHHDDDAAWMDR